MYSRQIYAKTGFMNHVDLLRTKEILKELQRQVTKGHFPEGILKENFVIDCVAFSES